MPEVLTVVRNGVEHPVVEHDLTRVPLIPEDIHENVKRFSERICDQFTDTISPHEKPHVPNVVHTHAN